MLLQLADDERGPGFSPLRVVLVVGCGECLAEARGDQLPDPAGLIDLAIWAGVGRFDLTAGQRGGPILDSRIRYLNTGIPGGLGLGRGRAG